MQYYVKLKDNHLLKDYMIEIVTELEQNTYEKRFPYEEKLVEVYKEGTFGECKQFIDDIADEKLKEEFEIIELNENN